MRIEDLKNLDLQAQARQILGLPLDPIQRVLDPTPIQDHQDTEEKELQRLCEQELTFHHISFLHLSFRAREKKGWPDLVFCAAGRPYAIELKSASGYLTQDQTRMLAQLKDNGWYTYVVRSYDAFTAILHNRSDRSVPARTAKENTNAK